MDVLSRVRENELPSEQSFSSVPSSSRLGTSHQSLTLKTRQLTLGDLDDFVSCYHTANRQERVETERFRPFAYEELMARDKASLDTFSVAARAS